MSALFVAGAISYACTRKPSIPRQMSVATFHEIWVSTFVALRENACLERGPYSAHHAHATVGI